MKRYLIALLVLATLKGYTQKPGKRPNIILIVSDEHNASIMRCAGDHIVNTPNLDELAASGIRLNANYSSSPICVPSRQTMLTGKYVSHHNVWGNNGTGVSNNSPSLPRILTAGGYDAYLVGHMHLKGMNYGFTTYTAKTNGIPPTEINSKPDPPKLRKRIPPSSFKDNGTKLEKEFSPLGEVDNMDNMKDGPRRDDAIAFLKQRKETDKPFFLVVGFNAPHYPLVAEKKYLDKYKDKVPPPYIPDGYTDKLPLNYKHLRNERKFERVPEDTAKLAREAYYARVEWIDEQIGRVLKTLKKSPFAENTVVIYTSDHGENLGEHGLWWKNCMYDCGARVPLIMSWPARWKGGQVRNKATGSVDVTQTIAELAGAATPADWDGHSMLAWLNNPEKRWKDVAISEFYALYIASGITMIRQGDWKYVYHARADATYGPERELYNLKDDPKELKNLAGLARYQTKIDALHQLLVKELREDPEHIEARWRNGATPEFPNGITQ